VTYGRYVESKKRNNNLLLHANNQKLRQIFYGRQQGIQDTDDSFSEKCGLN